MSKLSILFFAFLIFFVKENHGSLVTNEQVVAAAFTPVKRNGDINEEAIMKMAQKYDTDNIRAILIGSFAGEGPSMDLCTKKRLVEVWVKAGVRFNLQIMVDAGAMAFTDVLKLVKFCAGLEVTAVFVLPEIVYKAKTVDEAIEDLQLIYKVAPKLRIIYHDLQFITNPVVSSIKIYIEALSKIPTLSGIATTMGTAIELRRILGPMQDKLVIVIGNDVNAPLVLKLGIHLSIWPNLYPKLVLKIVAARNAGECGKAADIQSVLSVLIGCSSKSADYDYTSRTFVENQKLTYQYINGLNLRKFLPLREVNETVAAKIKTCLSKYRII